MPITADQVVVELQAKVDDYIRDVSRASSTLERSAQDMADSLVRLERSGSLSLEQLAIEAELTGRKIGEALGGRSARSMRNEDIQEYGRQLDALRAKFNPIFAASKQYEASLDEINRAHKLGAISSQEQAAAIQRLNAQYSAQAKAVSAAGNSSRMAQMQMRNLAFQFQDIGTMLAVGQSPFMLLAQQLPQVTMYGGQLTGVMGALKSTAANLVSPLGLATTAFVLLGSAAISYFSSSSSEAKGLNDVLEIHRKMLEGIIDGYRRAGDAAKGYRDEALRLSPREAQIEVQITQKGLQSRYIDEMDRLRKVLSELQKWAEGVGLKGLASQVQGMAEEAAKADPQMQSILEGLKAIKLEGFNAPGLETFVATALSAAESVRSLGAEISSADEATKYLNNLEDAWARVDAAINRIDSSRARKEIQELTDKFKEGEISLEDLIKVLGDLSASSPDLQSHIDEIGRLGLAADVARQKIQEMYAPIGGETVAGGKSGRVSNLPDVMTAPGFAPNREDVLAEQEKRAQRKNKKRENEYQRLTKQIEARTKALTAETEAQRGVNPLIDDYGYAAEKARLSAQLLIAAEQAKIEITPDLRKSIDEIAEGYAQASVSANKLSEAQNEARQNAEYWLGVGRDVTQGLTDDLLAGASAADVLSNALKRIGDALINDVLNGIFKIQNAGGGGLLGAIFGGLGGASSPSDPWAGLRGPGFARGTANTGGLRGEPRGIVHGQEAVIPLPSGGKVPVHIQAPSPGAAGLGGEVNYVDSRVITIDARGAQQGVGDEIRLALENYDRHVLPERFNQIARDPSARG